MKTVNKFFYMLLGVLFISCTEKTTALHEIDYTADKLIYKLEILDNFSDSLYKTDNHNKCEVLVSKSIYINGKFYQDGTKQMGKVIDYCKKNKQKIDVDKSVRLRTTISIKTNNDTFKEAFIWEDGISIIYASNNQEEDSYAIREGKIKLDTGCVKDKDEIRYCCLKIIFDEPGSEGGFKQNILNFARTGNTWELLKRERINTINNDPDTVKKGYCYDTIFYNCESVIRDSENMFITHTMMFDLQDPKCY